MSFKKGEKYQSSVRPYSYVGGNKAGGSKFHTMPQAELNKWFLRWGIIGERQLGRQNP